MDFSTLLPGAGQVFAFDISTIVFLVIVLIFFIVYMVKGFTYAITAFLCSIATYIAAFAAYQFLGGLIYDYVLGKFLVNMLTKNFTSIFSSDLVVSAENFATAMPEILNTFKIPEAVQTPILSIIQPLFNFGEEGLSAATAAAEGLTHLLSLALGFLLSFIVASIIFGIVKKIVKKLSKNGHFGFLDRLFGGILGILIGALSAAFVVSLAGTILSLFKINDIAGFEIFASSADSYSIGRSAYTFVMSFLSLFVK